MMAYTTPKHDALIQASGAISPAIVPTFEVRLEEKGPKTATSLHVNFNGPVVGAVEDYAVYVGDYSLTVDIGQFLLTDSLYGIVVMSPSLMIPFHRRAMASGSSDKSLDDLPILLRIYTHGTTGAVNPWHFIYNSDRLPRLFPRFHGARGPLTHLDVQIWAIRAPDGVLVPWQLPAGDGMASISLRFVHMSILPQYIHHTAFKAQPVPRPVAGGTLLPAPPAGRHPTYAHRSGRPHLALPAAAAITDTSSVTVAAAAAAASEEPPPKHPRRRHPLYQISHHV